MFTQLKADFNREWIDITKFPLTLDSGFVSEELKQRLHKLGFTQIIIAGKGNYVFTVKDKKQKASSWKKDLNLQESKWGLRDGTAEEVFAYMLERFRAWYEDEDIPAQVFKAVSAKQLSQPLDIHLRVYAVHAFSQLPEATALAAANKRVSNILEKQANELGAEKISEDLLQEPAERLLAQLLSQKAGLLGQLSEDRHYTEALAALADLEKPIDSFFDQVMVMVEEPELRDNRLRLLKSLRDLFLQVADISKLVVTR